MPPEHIVAIAQDVISVVDEFIGLYINDLVAAVYPLAPEPVEDALHPRPVQRGRAHRERRGRGRGR